jgi:hypothetical protein
VKIPSESTFFLSQSCGGKTWRTEKQDAGQFMGQPISMDQVTFESRYYEEALESLKKASYSPTAPLFFNPRNPPEVYVKMRELKTLSAKANYYAEVYWGLSEKFEAGELAEDEYAHEKRWLDAIYDGQISGYCMFVGVGLNVLSEGGYESLYENNDTAGKMAADMRTIFNNLRESIKQGSRGVDHIAANANTKYVTLADLDYFYGEEFDELLAAINAPKKDLGLRGNFPKPRTVEQEKEIYKIYGDAQKKVLANNDISNFLKAAINKRLAFGAYFIQNRSQFEAYLSVKKYY